MRHVTVLSTGPETQVILEKYIRLRASLKPYIAELAGNVTKSGVPTMRPLWYKENLMTRPLLFFPYKTQGL